MAIGDTLPFAIGIALSPIPIIAVILMLFSAKARENGPAFLGGWIAGIAAVVVIVTIVTGAAGASSGGVGTLAALLKLALGLLLLGLAWHEWRSRPAPGQAAEVPKWMAQVDSMQPMQAFTLGVVLSAVNPKNLTLAVGAALVIGSAGLDLVQSFLTVLVFVAVASLSIAVPVIYYLVGGEPARHTLDGWKAWLTQNNATVMAVLLLVMGGVLAGKGIGALIG
jgi:threonine/homoserine/homoserine lactone efflux protein